MKTLYILQNRFEYYPDTSIGWIRIDGSHFCYTLGDTVRAEGVKIYGRTAIPPSSAEGYDVSIRYSNKFKRNVLCLHTEKDGITLISGGIKFTYVYSHGGNTHLDTDGCVIVAHLRYNDKVSDSAEKELFDLVEDHIKNGGNVKWILTNGRQEK